MDLSTSVRWGSSAVKATHGWPIPPPAVSAYNDEMAMGFIRAVHKRSIRVPEDVSVVGFDNSYETGPVAPALTAVEAPLRALGSAAVSNLLAFAQGAQSRPGRPLVLPARLIIRDSTSAPARLPALTCPYSECV
ncbi:substrate-binding domain-containing protein [Arthrobacter sp. HMWF013]|uniref:substrate-binding domain-containing protein n=1 Tax=Arthrobacter sp. HMWF013 TaxID=2056849 RepID=UPI000D3A155F|nr:substrate-binding domain-containing protein [Arthrobacter sp. HMWF013]PTT70454.1 hypothetical protein DBR22_01045 [Arthrobacter sp. HMWF013]